MSAALLPTDRDPLRRLGTMALVTGLLGLAGVIYSTVNFVRERTSGEEWILGVGGSLLFSAVLASLVHGVLLGHRSRIEALEKGAAARANRPADGASS